MSESFLRLYVKAARMEWNALVWFELADRTLEIHFRRGAPERVSSTSPEDQLGPFLVQRGLLSPGQLAQAEAARGQFGGELSGALLGLSLLNPTTAFSQFAQHAQGLLLKALSAESASHRIEAKELPPAQALPLGHRWAVLMDLLRKIPSAELRKKLGPQLDLPVRKSTPQIPLQELRPSPQELRALSFIDGTQSLNQLIQAKPTEADSLLRLAWLLPELQGLSFLAQPSSPAAAPRPPAPPSAVQATSPAPARGASAPPPPTAPPAVAPGPIPLEELKAKASKLKEQNHFQVLGLPEQTTTAAVKAAYLKLAKQYHPDAAPAGSTEEEIRVRSDLFAAIGEAHRRLGDDKSRSEYLEELKVGSGGEVELDQILLGEELFQKGCILVKARKYPQAVETLSEAILVNANEGEFYAWRGFARFFAAADKRASFPEAKKDLDAALQKNPRCAPAFYFYGQMAKVLGDSATALKYFQKTVELQPGHTEAQREIRLLERK